MQPNVAAQTWIALMKRSVSAPLDSTRPVAEQLQFLVLPGVVRADVGSVYESLHAYMRHAVSPYFNTLLSVRLLLNWTLIVARVALVMGRVRHATKRTASWWPKRSWPSWNCRFCSYSSLSTFPKSTWPFILSSKRPLNTCAFWFLLLITKQCSARRQGNVRMLTIWARPCRIRPF